MNSAGFEQTHVTSTWNACCSGLPAGDSVRFGRVYCSPTGFFLKLNRGNFKTQLGKFCGPTGVFYSPNCGPFHAKLCFRQREIHFLSSRNVISSEGLFWPHSASLPTLRGLAPAHWRAVRARGHTYTTRQACLQVLRQNLISQHSISQQKRHTTWSFFEKRIQIQIQFDFPQVIFVMVCCWSRRDVITRYC